MPLQISTQVSSQISTQTQGIFHLAFHVTNLDQARQFYAGVLGCIEGRSTATWVDFDFFGHQISLHVGTPLVWQRTSSVEGTPVPMPHFGAILPLADWQALAQRLEVVGVEFVLRPNIRFAGQAGEQGTMFFLDPFGNPIEMKGFADFEGIFAA